MNDMLIKLYIKFDLKLHDLASSEDGQDMVEYALLVALIAFGAVSGMRALSKALNTSFSNISVTLGTYST